ncbi:uncharacterized protein YALI1_A14274g [Yarrowia lipolytica]|uniref:Uncharacterized protein n=1 Tax=Yarrowia lipolytica TaxID=4952 RepID=A0A1D8N4R4_YARLL|nr:hypothetical protein YALI1_A14274g [Yarrowia lipolytica]
MSFQYLIPFFVIYFISDSYRLIGRLTTRPSTRNRTEPAITSEHVQNDDPTIPPARCLYVCSVTRFGPFIPNPSPCLVTNRYPPELERTILATKCDDSQQPTCG